MNTEIKVYKSPQVILEHLNNKAVLIDLKNGGFFELNAIALEIWNLINEKISIDSIITELSQKYQMNDSSKLESTTFIKKMIDRGLLLIAS